jgi:hypothetical protein
VRAYLLTVARRVSWEWHGARRDVPVSDDELTFRVGAGADAHARSAEHTLITTAFTSLPERWRTVLWQTEVEGEQPAMVAPHFGLSANATAALARRARQGLRAAYLQAHLAVNRSSDGCRAVVEKLGGFTAGSVTGTEARRIRTHLLGCASCRATHDELRDVCSSLRAHAGVIVLLVPAAALGLGGGGGALSGVATAMKSLVLGSKVKVGLALASTAAAGVFGVAVGPAVFNADSSQTVGLQGGAAPELKILEPGPGSPQSSKVTIGTDQLTVHAVQPAARAVRPDIVAAGVGAGVPTVDLPGAPGGGPAGPNDIPSYPIPASQPSDSGDPRLDTPVDRTTTTRADDVGSPDYTVTSDPEDTKPLESYAPTCHRPFPWRLIRHCKPWHQPPSAPAPSTTSIVQSTPVQSTAPETPAAPETTQSPDSPE